MKVMRHIFRTTVKQSRHRNRRRSSPRLELLEDRTLFAVNPIVAENQLPGTPESVWDCQRHWRPNDPGFRHEHERQRGADRIIQNQ